MELVIVPVAHVSERSVRKVRETIEQEQPDVVAIELDALRLRSMIEKREPRLRDLAAHPVAGMMYLFQKAVGKWLNVVPGNEMLAAVEAAAKRKIPVALIDQDINVTMARLAKIPLREKLSLLGQAFASPIFLLRRRAEIENAIQGKALAEFFVEFKRQLPSTYRVLVDDRDEHMFQRLRGIKAGKVVAVMGAGHAIGISRRIRESGGERLKGGLRFSLAVRKPGFAS